MRRWKVALGISLCTSLCCSALASDVTPAEPTKVQPSWSESLAKAQLVKQMSTSVQTGVNTPFTQAGGALTESSAPETFFRNLVGGGWVDPSAGNPETPAVREAGRVILEDAPGGLGATCAAAYAATCGEPNIVLRFTPPYVEDAERRPTCAGNLLYHEAVWFKFVATAPPGFTKTAALIDMCATGTAEIQDAILAVYRTTNPASPCGNNLVEIACKQDSVGCGGGIAPGRNPRVIVGDLNVGETYYVQVGVPSYTGSCTAPCTQGDYPLTITCDPALNPCQITIDPQQALLFGEQEVSPCVGEVGSMNGGCNDEIPAFSSITCGEIRYGTSYFDGATRDTDWYRVVLEPGSLTLQVGIRAEFFPVLGIIAPDPNTGGCGDDISFVATNDLASFVLCSNNFQTIQYTAPAPGEYYIFVAPDFCFGEVDCTRDYILQVNALPACNPATGACCNGTSCSVVAREDCVAPAVYYGDGTRCPGGGPDAIGACYSPLAGCVAEGEAYTCPGNGHADTFNGGCGVNDTAPPLTSINFDQNRCGVAGTHFDIAPPAATANQRDNDWYRLNLAVPVGEFRQITVSILTEFRAQVLIVNPDLGTNPCPTFADRIVTDQIVEPGVQTDVIGCVQKRSGVAFRGDVWVIIRPFSRGVPREIPCGVRYTFKVSQAVGICNNPGACCVITAAGVSSGCQQLTATQCAAAGGRFGGPGSACSSICCPCAAGSTAENEANCALPSDTTNSGCNGAAAGYPFGLGGALLQPGASWCGTSVWNGTNRDTDWFRYNHTGGDIVYTITADFVAQPLIITPGPGQTQAEKCTGLGIEFQGLTVPCEPFTMRFNVPAGEYYLWMGPDFDENDPFTCGRPYFATVTSESAPTITIRACCTPGFGCELLSQQDCVAQGGTWNANTTSCDPNPCGAPCPVTCGSATPENENNCTDPNAGTNGGCNSTPPVFGLFGGSGSSICGRSWYNADPNVGLRDTDWFYYQHAGGDLGWQITSEFFGTVIAIGPVYEPNNPCCDFYDTYTADFFASCEPEAVRIIGAAAGRWIFIIVPSFDAYPNGLTCGGANSAGDYRISIVSQNGAGGSPIGACCVGTDCGVTFQLFCANLGGVFQGAGTDCDPSPCGAPVTGACCVGATCSIQTAAACASASGQYQGDNTDCDPNPCAPVLCAGDMNCDGSVNFSDIDLFVEALSFPGGVGWPYPNCPWLNADANGDNDVTFADIDPFVNRIGANCP